MREVIGSVTPSEQSALRVIDAFDDASIGAPSLDSLVSVAHRLTGHQAGARDEWNNAQAIVGGDLPDDGGAYVARAATLERVRGRDASIIPTQFGDTLVASVETAGGRIGVCWLQQMGDRQFLSIDHLVAERLAKSVAQSALHARSQRDAAARIEDGAIERVLAGPTSELELAELARKARISLDDSYLVLAVSYDPPNALASPALAAEIQRRLGEGQHRVVRTASLQHTVAVLTTDFGELDAALDDVARHFATLSITLTGGIGNAAPLSQAWKSWRQAREALALHGARADGTTVMRYSGLGALQLLTHITEEQLLESELYRRMLDALPDTRSPSNAELLEAYLDEGSLRKAAAKLFLHHTTVESRIRKIETQLEVDITDSGKRFELQLLLKAAHVARRTREIPR